MNQVTNDRTDAAFPLEYKLYGSTGREYYVVDTGLSKREYLAMRLYIQLQNTDTFFNYPTLAQKAIDMADAFFDVLEKKPTQK